MFSLLRNKNASKQGPPIVPINYDDCCSSSKQALQPAHNKHQKKKSPSKMSTFTRHFCCCDSVDAAVDTNAVAADDAVDATASPAGIAPSKHDDDDDFHGFVLDLFGTLTRKEARAVYRMQLLTASQWVIVIESCGLVVESDANMAEMVKMVMEWRRRRGDFQRREDEEEEEQEHELEGDVGVPRLSDDMQEANEAILELGFLKTDLQVECLLRGIFYEGGDTKGQLISKLMHHKQFPSLSSDNSYKVLAEQST